MVTFLPQSAWPRDDYPRQQIRLNWADDVGDCRQQLVFIGQEIDFERLKTKLDDCLLTTEEVALGPDGWETFDDPFPPAFNQA